MFFVPTAEARCVIQPPQFRSELRNAGFRNSKEGANSAASGVSNAYAGIQPEMKAMIKTGIRATN